MKLFKYILLIQLVPFTLKAAPGQSFQPEIRVWKDSIPKDSIPPLNDLKKGFKNLFIGSELGDGIHSAQLNPQAITFVKDYMNRHSKGLKKMKDWGRPYFDMMDGILTQHGLPKELKYLAVIESHLKSGAVSWMGAVGPWQFMPATARRYGLRVNPQIDERTDYLKSTHAASRMLKDLFAQYGDWLLVIAAYNGGPGNVDKAIRRTGSKDFWTLQYRLPNESKDHVKKFISTHYIMEGEGGVTTLTKNEAREASLNKSSALTQLEMDNSSSLSIGARYEAGIIARHVEMTLPEFNRYNPNFKALSAAEGSYQLRLPKEKMDIFIAKKNEILNESLQFLLSR